MTDKEAALDERPSVLVEYQRVQRLQGTTSPLVAPPMLLGPQIAAMCRPRGLPKDGQRTRQGRESKQPTTVWFRQERKAAPYGLDRRGGHRERIAEGKQPYVISVRLGASVLMGERGLSTPPLLRRLSPA